MVFLALILTAFVITNLEVTLSWDFLPYLLDLLLLPVTLRFASFVFVAVKVLLKPARYDNAEAMLQTNKQKAWEVLTLVLSALGFGALLLWYAHWIPGQQLSFGNRKPYVDAVLVVTLMLELMNRSFIKRLWARFELTPPRIGLMFYLGASILGAYLLILPWSLLPGQSLGLVNSFFISVSAITVTGLSPINVAETFSVFGIIVLLVAIQIGGIGIALFSAMISSFARKRLSLFQSKVGQELYSVPDLGDVSVFLRNVFLLTAVIEIVGAVVIYTFLPSDLPHRFLHAVFHSVSAFCNAGFSTLPTGLEVEGLEGVKSVIAVMIVLGGLGFPVLFESIEKLRKKRKLPYSAESMLVLLTSVLLLVGGSVAIWGSHLLSSGHFDWKSLGSSVFLSISSRTAGFSTVSVADLATSSQLVLLVLMFIGASPVSTGGGVKTTTFALLLVAVWSFFRGNRWIQFHNREIPYYVLHKCVAVVFCYLFLSLFSIGFLYSIEDVDLWEATFECVSALSTVGLSVGVTEELGVAGKGLLCFLMIAGRYGLVTLVFAGIGRVRVQKYRVPQGRFFVG